MRAIVCHEPFQLDVIARDKPRPGPGEVLVHVKQIGLCGTDFHIFAGKHPFLHYPRVMGHELGGEIVALGEGASLRIGQQVAINPYLACGDCVACRRHKPNACVNIRVLGVHVDGGMCEFLAVPQTAVIDAEGLSPVQAAMVEFLAVGAHAAARAPKGGDHMLVVGAGPIGVATALFAALDGRRPLIVDRMAARVEFVRDRLGLDGLVADDRLDQALADWTNGDMFDVVVDATGSLAAMRRSLSFVAHGGALVLVGVAQGELSFEDPEFHKREATLIASRNALAEDFSRVIDAIKSGRIPTDVLNTHSIAAEELPVRLPEPIRDADTVLKVVASF